MVNILRRFQQPLMILVTVLIIISFSWLYNRNDFLDTGASSEAATIYGRRITYAQAQKVGRKFELCQDLGLVDLLQSLAVRRQDAKENFLWNSFVLRHEAEQLGIEPTDDQVFATIQAMPVFQTNGAYDSSKYNMIVQGALAPRGFTPEDMAELIEDDLRLKQIKALLGATVAPAESEVRQAYSDLNQKIEASVVRLKLADFLASTEVKEDEVKKLYEERKAALQTDEVRKVKYVAFVLATTDKPLEGKARAEELGKLGKQAEDFSVAMADKNAKLEEVAAKFGAQIQETTEFGRAVPPAELGGSAEASAAAFKLTPQQPNSDVIGTDRGYYVLQLAHIAPPRPLTFEESKDRLLDELKQERGREALSLKGAEIRNKIEAEIKAGKSFADAAQAAGGKPETFPPFSRREPQFEPPNSGEIMQTAMELEAGQLSTFVPSPDGGVIVHVTQRPPIDEEKFKTEKTQFTEGVAEFQKNALFQQWLKLRRDAAGLQIHFKG